MTTFKLLPGIMMIMTLGRAPAPASAPDLAGFYLCDGEDADGRPYRGLVEIRSRGAAYRVEWVFSSTDVHHGIGVVSGNTLAVNYVSGRHAGIAVYVVGDGTRLIGQWTVVGAPGRTYPEILRRLVKDSRQPRRPEPRPKRLPV